MAQCISGRGGSVPQKSVKALKKRCKNKSISGVTFDIQLSAEICGNLATLLSLSENRHRCRKVICDTAVAYLLPLFRNLKSENRHRCRFSLSRVGKNDTAVVFSSKAKENQVRKPESVVQISEQQKNQVCRFLQSRWRKLWKGFGEFTKAYWKKFHCWNICHCPILANVLQRRNSA
jgi:hypothetical protein